MKEKFLRIMTGPKGRVGRVLMGFVLLILGLYVIRGTIGLIMTIASLIPIAAGLFDFCLVAGLMGYPLSGAKVRRRLGGE